MSVKLDGVKETLRALRKFDPELLKEMNKEIKKRFSGSYETRSS